MTQTIELSIEELDIINTYINKQGNIEYITISKDVDVGDVIKIEHELKFNDKMGTFSVSLSTC